MGEPEVAIHVNLRRKGDAKEQICALRLFPNWSQGRAIQQTPAHSYINTLTETIRI
jgi:hypothetical protein